MKRTIDRFLFTVTLVASVGLIVTGVSLASFRSAEIMEGKSYSSFVFANSAQKLEIGSEDKTVEIDKSVFEKIREYKDILYFTPFGAVYGLIDEMTTDDKVW